MAEPTDPGVIDVASETVVIALELADAELKNAPGRLASALLSSDVQTALTKTAEEVARKRLNATTTTVSEKDAKELGEKLLEQTKDAALEHLKTEIKNSSKYQQLDASIKKLKETFAKTPMGVWLDENKNILYIVGVGAVLGGAAAMYVFRTGDTVTKTIMPLVGGQSVSFKLLGKLEVEAGVGKIVFTPSEHLIDAKTFINAKWQQISVKLNLAATVADGKVTAASADGKIVIPVHKGVTLGAGGSVDAAKKVWSLNVSVNLDVTKNVQIGVLAGIGKGGFGPSLDSNALKAIPDVPKSNDRTAGFVGLGISASF